MAIHIGNDSGKSAYPPMMFDGDVKIVWQGRRIAKLVFPSGKTIQFNDATIHASNNDPSGTKPSITPPDSRGK